MYPLVFCFVCFVVRTLNVSLLSMNFEGFIWYFVVLVTQSYLTFCDPMDCSQPGSSVHGILQAKILEWVAMPSSRGSSRFRNQTHVSYVSCIGGGFFTTSAAWETHSVVFQLLLSHGV